jgi:hypothetical protein
VGNLYEPPKPGKNQPAFKTQPPLVTPRRGWVTNAELLRSFMDLDLVNNHVWLIHGWVSQIQSLSESLKLPMTLRMHL